MRQLIEKIKERSDKLKQTSDDVNRNRQSNKASDGER